MPAIIDISSKNEIIVQKLKKLSESRRTIDGKTSEPKSPSIVATKKNILSPPPRLIECLLRLNQHDAKRNPHENIAK